MNKKLFMVLPVILLMYAACTEQGTLQPDCAIDAGPCERTVDGLAVILDVTPRPVRAMRDLSFSVRLERGGRPVRAAGVGIDLEMPGMNMGENRILLQPAGEGVFRGQGVIVRCPSGKTLWKASVRIAEGDRTTRAEYLFDAP